MKIIKYQSVFSISSSQDRVIKSQGEAIPQWYFNPMKELLDWYEIDKVDTIIPTEGLNQKVQELSFE